MTGTAQSVLSLQGVLEFGGTPAHQLQRVRFKTGLFAEYELLLVADAGAITTLDRLGHLDQSLAHLFKNGVIMRYGAKIGTMEDLEVVH